MSNFKDFESKTLNPGSSIPELKGNELRLFNMRFCPFAQRAVLTMAAKKIPVTCVNVNLVNKPDWLTARNPRGQAPTLETADGRVVYESGLSVEWLDENFPGKKILPADGYQKIQQKMLTELISSKIIAPFYGYCKNKTQENIDVINNNMDYVEKLLKGDYFCGNDTGYVDYMIWPFFDKYMALRVATDGKIGPNQDRHPKLHAYCERMAARDEVKAVARPGHYHLEFVDSMIAGEPKYDLGL